MSNKRDPKDTQRRREFIKNQVKDSGLSWHAANKKCREVHGMGIDSRDLSKLCKGEKLSKAKNAPGTTAPRDYSQAQNYWADYYDLTVKYVKHVYSSSKKKYNDIVTILSR